MEVSTIKIERLGNDSLQFQKNTDHILSSPRCLGIENTFTGTKSTSNATNNNHHNDEQLMADISKTLETLLVQVDSGIYPIVTATTSQTSIYDSCTKVSLITPVKDEDVNKTTDIVMLRNLEITPPPQDLILKATPSPNPIKEIVNNSTRKRRSFKRTESEQSDESSVSGRSKRQRRQTELFQVQSESVQKSKSNSNSTRKQTKLEPAPQIKQEDPKFQDVIFYEKGDHLAIRNEENNFYLCQLTENVRVQKPFVKVRWLDTTDGGKTYFSTDHYDKVPQKSIIMPVTLDKMKPEKRGKQLFAINDQIKNSVLDRLKRSINTPAE